MKDNWEGQRWHLESDRTPDGSDLLVVDESGLGVVEFRFTAVNSNSAADDVEQAEDWAAWTRVVPELRESALELLGLAAPYSACQLPGCECGACRFERLRSVVRRAVQRAQAHTDWSSRW